MYTVNADVFNLFSVPASDQYPASWKVQLIGDSQMKDGQIKKEMLTLSVPEEIYNSLQGQIGKPVTLPISFFVSNNRLNPFFPKNTAVELPPKGGQK